MNSKFLARLIFLIVLLLLLVLIGVYNREPVELTLPILCPRGIKLPAAIMYFLFLAIGLVSGALFAGAGKKTGGK